MWKEKVLDQLTFGTSCSMTKPAEPSLHEQWQVGVVLVHEAAFTLGGLSRHHQGRGMVMFRGYLAHGVAAFIGFETQAKLVQLKCTALHTLPFGFNPGDARDIHTAAL